ncbi:NUDIX domain-containing protein [Alkaliphilus pronyensis]|uniref:NUDIX domain-containing protein n=1 Tax=Alkaliphilus pronyensis TaxID=1482732 RepID=A0A6I0EW27_9FIRM|nr:NUDIX domain-containing protein [Alkaliphilus pronyensis]KAB3530928.1 NUDIX domain-containing protein [Alkaliphilus pronyensis]
MIQKDWYFSNQDSICSFRSAGVLIRNNKILLQRDKGGAEYALPGGHVKIGETAAESLVREYKEETGAIITCEKLVWIEECFWHWNKKSANTISFYYLISLVNNSEIPDNGEFISQKDNCDVLLGWMPLESIQSLTIYPSFIKEKIFNISDNVEHFITVE